MEFTVAGEVEPITEQAINFAKLNASPERVAALVSPHLTAPCDNAAFDLLGFVTYKFQKGMAKFAAYPHLQPLRLRQRTAVSACYVCEEITLDENIGKNIAKRRLPLCGTSA